MTDRSVGEADLTDGVSMLPAWSDEEPVVSLEEKWVRPGLELSSCSRRAFCEQVEAFKCSGMSRVMAVTLSLRKADIKAQPLGIVCHTLQEGRLPWHVSPSGWTGRDDF